MSEQLTVSAGDSPVNKLPSVVLVSGFLFLITEFYRHCVLAGSGVHTRHFPGGKAGCNSNLDRKMERLFVISFSPSRNKLSFSVLKKIKAFF